MLVAQQNGRLNTDLDNKLTSSYYDGAKWHMFIKALNADIEALGSTTDPATASTVIGLLKSLVAKLPSSLQNDAIKAVLTTSLPAGTNKIGSVDIANNPTVRVDSNTPVNVNVQNQPTVKVDDATPINVAINGGGSMDVNVTNTEPIPVSLGTTSGMMDVAIQSVNPNLMFFAMTVNSMDIFHHSVVAENANTPEYLFPPGEFSGIGREIIVFAPTTNAGNVYIGGNNNGLSITVENGIPIAPGEKFRMEFSGSVMFYIAENAGDKLGVAIPYIPAQFLNPTG